MTINLFTRAIGYINIWNLGEALNLLFEARIYAQKNKEVVLLTKIELNLAYIFLHCGYYNKTQKICINLLKSFKGVDYYRYADILIKIGLVHLIKNDTQEAGIYFKKAFSLKKRYNDICLTTIIDFYYALYLLKTKKYYLLRKILNKNLDYSLQNKEYNDTFDFYYLYSLYYFRNGKYNLAFEYSKKAIGILDNKGRKKITGETVPYLILLHSKILKVLGKDEMAKRYYNDFNRFNSKFLNSFQGKYKSFKPRDKNQLERYLEFFLK
jgi:tetratricopeptide (TPR) repeat protein